MASTCREKSALFVCLGNICRSTMAEAILKSLVQERKSEHLWDIDSAGTMDYNVGCPPDERTLKTLKAHHITNYKHTGRVINHEDFYMYKYIFVMDESNMRDVTEIKPKDSNSQIVMLGSYDYGNSPIIKDPYFQDGAAHFEPLFQKCLVCCKNFLDSLEQ